MSSSGGSGGDWLSGKRLRSGTAESALAARRSNADMRQVTLTLPPAAGSWRKRDVLYWVGVTAVVPVVGRALWWAAEKTYNLVTPYHVSAGCLLPSQTR